MAYFYSPFRKAYAKDASGACAFCDTERMQAQSIRDGQGPIENASHRWIVNQYPKFEGHTMLVPKRHVTMPGTETDQEVLDREALLRRAVEVMRVLFPGAGLEIFQQAGAGSEASVAHLHWHLVPASPEDPLRSFEKLGQFYTIEPGKERVVIFPIPIKRSPDELLRELSRAASSQNGGNP